MQFKHPRIFLICVTILVLFINYFCGRMKVEIEDIRIVVERKFVSEIRLVSICRTDWFSTK